MALLSCFKLCYYFLQGHNSPLFSFLANEAQSVDVRCSARVHNFPLCMVLGDQTDHPFHFSVSRCRGLCVCWLWSAKSLQPSVVYQLYLNKSPKSSAMQFLFCMCVQKVDDAVVSNCTGSQVFLGDGINVHQSIAESILPTPVIQITPTSDYCKQIIKKVVSNLASLIGCLEVSWTEPLCT